MAAEMPIRDENAAQATWSDRAFQFAIPNEWTIHPIAEDYGIDRRVELFAGKRATGLFFNVQLKSKRTGSGERPFDAIKRSTLNYWAAMAEPTLIVIAHEPSNRLWYQWAHLLPWEENSSTKKRQVRCETQWTNDTPAALFEEVQAFRSVADLSNSMPVPVVVTGSRFYGESASKLKATLASKLRDHNSVVTFAVNSSSFPRFEVKIEDQGIRVGVKGQLDRQLTFEFIGPRPYALVADEVIAALGVAAVRASADPIAVRLLSAVAGRSDMLVRTQGLPAVIAFLAARGEHKTIMALLRRSVFREDSVSGPLPLVPLRTRDADPVLVRAVADELAQHARTWAKPGIGLYNAGNALRQLDPGAAIDLYDEAAAESPEYLSRAYWWKEKGSALWDLGQAQDALDCYARAIEFGDDDSKAYQADALMRTGHYGEARALFMAAPIYSDPRDAQWRLSIRALDYVVDTLGIPEQERTPPGPFGATEDPAERLQAATDALRSDALDEEALLLLCSAQEASGSLQLGAAVTAAVAVNTNPDLWLALIAYVVSELPHEEGAPIVHDAMVCAWQNFATSFTEMILLDERLNDEQMDALTTLYEAVRPEARPFELRHHGPDGTESIFI